MESNAAPPPPRRRRLNPQQPPILLGQCTLCPPDAQEQNLVFWTNLKMCHRHRAASSIAARSQLEVCGAGEACGNEPLENKCLYCFNLHIIEIHRQEPRGEINLEDRNNLGAAAAAAQARRRVLAQIVEVRQFSQQGVNDLIALDDRLNELEITLEGEAGHP